MSRDFPQGTETRFDSTVLTSQIITGAVMAGVIFFGAVLIMVRQQNPANPGLPVISMAAAGLAALMIVLRFLLPSVIVGGFRKRIVQRIREGKLSDSAETASQLFSAFTAKLIASLAVLDGAAIFCLVAYMIEGRWWMLATAAILWFMMAVQFPTRNRVEYWVRDQLQLMEMERS